MVSIIMPLYNSQDYIKEAISSVLNQSYMDFELIIINDGSTDRSVEIVESFDDSRIIFLSQNNRGVSSARNRGLDICFGEYITFLDSDDVLPIDSLKSRVEYLEENRDVDLVDGIISVQNSSLSSEMREYKPYYNGYLLDKLLLLDDRVFFNVCYFFRADILDNRQFDTSFTHCEDLLFFIELSQKRAITYGYVEDIIYIYRDTPNSAMSRIDDLERGYISLLKKIRGISHIRVSRIIFLSWLFDGKDIYRAFRSIFRVLSI